MTMSPWKDAESFGLVRTIALTEAGESTAVDGSSGYGASSTGEWTPPVAQRVGPRRAGGQPQPTAGLRPESRRALRADWQAAKGAAARLLAAADGDDPMARLVAADDLDGLLARMWDLREGRDINWQAILNHTQGMLKQFFADKQV